MQAQHALRRDAHRVLWRMTTSELLVVEGIARHDKQTIGIGEFDSRWNLS
jgi:hypothetical protein